MVIRDVGVLRHACIVHNYGCLGRPVTGKASGSLAPKRQWGDLPLSTIYLSFADPFLA